MTLDEPWPQRAVRPWRDVLVTREVARLEDDFMNAGARQVTEALMAAADCREEQRLRGVVIGQIAQIEDLLVHIAHHGEHRLAGKPVPKHGYPVAAYDALARVLTLLCATKLASEDTLGALVEAAQALRRRDHLVTASFSPGYSHPPTGDPIHVITLMSDGDLPIEDERGDISLKMFDRFLEQAQQALERLLDIWEELDETLPAAPESE